ncbi:hypothetical protein MLD38_005014 [Melastoma candidum]|uniref:Uncharacterized protein n=1 Tax=Melastoma candidum TaxID=119954 RepID=A0ACB9S7N6_9MYRT|nr:hypothetical protein MLD38_005014 [Melastoma candidum]
MSSSGGRDMTRSPNIDSPPTSARTSPDNSIRNDKKKRSIIPKIFGSKRGGKSREDGDPYRFDAEAEDDEVDLGRSPIHESGSVRNDSSRGKAFVEASPLVPKSLSERHSNPRIEGLDLSCSDLSMSPGPDIREFRVFVGTWNVGGRTPTSSLNLEDFLQVEGSTDVYVLGFQEIVPLSAGNVLVAEDNEPASKWLLLINQALNRPNYDSDSSGRGSTSTDSVAPASDDKHYFQKPTLKHIIKNLRADSIFLKSCNCHLLNPTPDPKSPNREGSRNRKKHGDDGDNHGMEYTTHSGPIDSAHAQELFHPRYLDNVEIHCEGEKNPGREEHRLSSAFSPYPCSYCRYRLVASKQMVGLFLTVWVRKELVQHIGHLRMTSIGRGIMGYLGNKGCISVSMSLHNTSFCFVCSHLASGEKEGDELRRNADVSEIIKNTQFPRICRSLDRRDPEKILHHDRVIWMGDLNYRVSLSYEETRSLLEDNDWDSLLQRDQLNTERKAGRVFSRFKEGRIFFAPTYKYALNSDCYAGETGKPKKRRTPAWCDRILWSGNGIEQLSYIRGESRFSDHRPVCSVFSVEVELKSERRPGRLRKGYTRAATRADYDERMHPHQQYYEL